MKIKRTKKEMKKLGKLAKKHDGLFADSYENGIRYTIDWLTGKSKINPFKGYKNVVEHKAK